MEYTKRLRAGTTFSLLEGTRRFKFATNHPPPPPPVFLGLSRYVRTPADSALNAQAALLAAHGLVVAEYVSIRLALMWDIIIIFTRKKCVFDRKMNTKIRK